MTPDIAANVSELARPYTHVELVHTWTATRNRTTKERRIRLPALIDQLRAAAVPDTNHQPGGRGQASEPCRLDAVDTLRTIEAGTLGWQRRLALNPRPRVEDRLSALVAAHASATRANPDLADELETDVTTWHLAARVVTGWDVPPLPLRWQCPACAEHTLRVRRDGSTAWCAHCGTRWDGTQVGILAAQLHSNTPVTVGA